MNDDADAAQSAANLGNIQGPFLPSGRQGDTDAAYRAAITVGALDTNGNIGAGAETPLLSRRDTYESRRESPDRSNADHGSDRQHSPPTWQGDFDFAGLPCYKKPSVFWLLFPFLLYALTFGGTILPGIEVIRQLLCREKLIEQMSSNGTSLATTSPLILQEPYLDPDFCKTNPEVQAAVAIFTLWGQVIAGILSAITSPKIGSLSDRYGRVQFLALTACGTLVKDLVFIMIFTWPLTLNVRWLLLAYAIDGICGSFTAGMAITNAYASDCTPPNKRAVRFGWFQGCLFTGVALGPIAAGYVVKLTGQIVNMFYIALGMHVFFILFCLFVAPESRSKARQKEARAKKAEMDLRWTFTGSADGIFLRSVWRWLQGHNIFEPLKILFPTGPGTNWDLRRNMIILTWVDTTMFAVAMGAMTVTIIYTQATFDWDIVQTSAFMSIVNVARVSVLLVILPLVLRLARGKGVARETLKESGCDTIDKWIIVIAVAFDLFGFIGYAIAPTGTIMILAGVIASIGGMASPTLQSSMTKHVPRDHIGQLFGATGLLHALARVVAPVACNYIYAKMVVRGAPQVVFICLAACFGIAFLGSLFIKKGVYIDAQAVEDEQQRLLREDEEFT